MQISNAPTNWLLAHRLLFAKIKNNKIKPWGKLQNGKEYTISILE